MNKFIIEKHDFEIYKKKLNDIIKATDENIKLRTVNFEDKKLFGLVKSTHYVTGEELNGLVRDIGNNLKKIGERFLKNYNGLLEIYKLFNIIDEKYVVSIQKAIDNLIITNEKLQLSQEDIKKLYNVQHKTLEKLVEFKQRLEETRILSNIDTIYEEINNLNTLLDENKDEMEKIISIISNFQNELKKFEDKITYFGLKNNELEKKFENKINILEEKNNELEKKIEKEIFKTKILSVFFIIILLIVFSLIFIRGF